MNRIGTRTARRGAVALLASLALGLASLTMAAAAQASPLTAPHAPSVTTTAPATIVGGPMSVHVQATPFDGAVGFAYWWGTGSSATPPVFSAFPACGSTGVVGWACPAPGTGYVDVTVAPIDRFSTLFVATYNGAGQVSPVTALPVVARIDSTDFGLANGHLWDSTFLDEGDTTVPDSNTTDGSDGTTTNQELAPVSMLADDADFAPSPVLEFGDGVPVATTGRAAVDTRDSFTVSAWIRLSGTASATDHVAVSQAGADGSAFTLGLDADGSPQFCRTSQVDDVTTCTAPTSAAVSGSWVMLTGVWDAANRQLRVLTNTSIQADAVAGVPIAANDTSSDGAFCVGAACSDAPGGSASDAWDGAVYRPAVFPGVISGSQLVNLWDLFTPNGE